MLVNSTRLLSWWTDLDGVWQQILVSTLGLTGVFSPEHDLEYIHTITELDCSGTRLMNLEPIRMLPNLRYLDISETQIQNLSPLRNLHQLEELHASFCQFSSIRSLLHLSELTILDISYPYNPIPDLPLLACMPSLRELYLNACMMKDMGFLNNLPDLEILSLHFNQLDQGAVDSFEQGHRACTVLF